MVGSRGASLGSFVLVALAGCGGAEQRSPSEVDASYGPPSAGSRAELHAFAPPLSNEALERASALRARGLLVRSIDDAARFEQRAERSTTFFSSTGLTFAVSSGDQAWALRATMPGAAAVSPEPEEEQASRLVTTSAERPAFARVAWNELYPGIDMVAGPAPTGGTEYQFVLSPGAKVESIAMRWEGATKVEPVEGGVDVVTDIGALQIRGLHAFAIDRGARKELPARHVVRGDTVSFEVDGWDGRTELVIDPVVSWSSFAGGGNADAAYALALDASGNVYLGGQTASSDFPRTVGSYVGNNDIFVMKLTAAGAITWSAVYGGAGNESVTGLAVDGAGAVYFVGSTSSINFPATGGFDTTSNGNGDALVGKLTAAGAIAWAGYLGGSALDDGRGIALDASANVFVTGKTSSTNFPTSNAFQATFGGNTDAFVTKLSSAGVIRWSTYLGGSGTENNSIREGGIAVDGSGGVFVGGTTQSPDFPVSSGAYQTSIANSNPHGFLTKFVDGTTPTRAWSTFVAGTGTETIYGVASSGGAAFLSGRTTSSNFPVTNGSTKKGTYDAFVTAFSGTGALSWSTYYGGTGDEWAFDVAVGNNAVFVTGSTTSTDLPTTGAFKATSGGGTDAFVARLSAGTLQWSSYLGGSGTDQGFAIAADATNNAFVAGDTTSSNFSLSGAFDGTFSVQEGFVVRVRPAAVGAACTSAADCGGPCVAGFCCNNACGGTCRACSNAKTGAANGTCANVKNGTDPDNECAAATCTVTSGSATRTPKQTCNGAGACTTTAASSCGLYLCNGAACRTTCTADGNCASTAYCAGTSCVAKKTNGSACTAANQCTSGFCVDGVCCNAACTGKCQACSNAKTGAANGACANVKAGTDPDGECAAASCTAGRATPKQTCTGGGACTTSAAVSCGAFPCSGAVCGTTCTIDANCAAGAYCAGGTCTAKKANGGACTAANQCNSGFCTDGVCCESACSGSCEACSAAKKGSGADGTCGPIASGADPESECPAASCTGGMASPKQTCNGIGACTTTPAVSCGAFPCSGAACATTCTTDASCAAGAYCDAGTCTVKEADGGACTAANQCASGFCVDGVCCDGACTGTCMACSAATKGSGTDGTCGPIVSGTDPENECPAASCTAGGATPKETCDGAGACTASTPTACAPYVCAGTECATTCASDTDCVAPNVCTADACVPPVEPDAGVDTGTDTGTDTGADDTSVEDTGVVDTGVVDTGADTGVTPPDTGSPGDKPVVTGGYGACTTASECASGFCVDGGCCARACDGTCESCTMPFAPGVCVPVPMGLDPKMQCSAIPCTRTCNGAGSCINAFTGAQCAPARCTGPSTGAGPAVCSAEGSACPTDQSIPFDCGAYACAQAIGACFQMCTSTDQCAPGNVCDLATKSCVPAGAPTADDGGCSVHDAGTGGTSAIGALFALAALGTLRRRRAVAG